MINLKKAAMFGIDARVALAIMGTLSLIAGVCILGAAHSARMSKIAFEGKEVAKAIEQYEYDTRSSLPIYSNNSVLKVSELSSSAKAGWKGPYLTVKSKSGLDANTYLYSAKLGRFSVLRTKDRGAATVATSPYIACDDTAPCYLWILYDDAELIEQNKVAFSRLDDQLDGKDGFLTGRVQKYNDALLIRWNRVDF